MTALQKFRSVAKSTQSTDESSQSSANTAIAARGRGARGLLLKTQASCSGYRKLTRESRTITADGANYPELRLYGSRKKRSRPSQGSLKRYDASAHRLLRRSAQGVGGVGPVRRQSIASPNAVSPGPSPKLGRGLCHLRLSIELIPRLSMAAVRPRL